MTLPSRSIALATGVTLDYAEHGDPAGLPVVFLHGITDSWRSFERVLPLLPDALHAMSVTQRGHGDSSRPASGYGTRDFAADVAAFLDARGIRRAAIVGHSMGSSNALRFAIDHPTRVTGLVLVAAFASYAQKPDLVAFIDTVATLQDPIDPAFAREFQESTLAHPVPPAFLDMVVGESMKLPAHVWQAAFTGLLADDFTDQIAAVRAPTLLIWGDRDTYALRADQDTLLASIPGSRLIAYEGYGHALHWEDHERFAADVASFAATLPATS